MQANPKLTTDAPRELAETAGHLRGACTELEQFVDTLLAEHERLSEALAESFRTL